MKIKFLIEQTLKDAFGHLLEGLDQKIAFFWASPSPVKVSIYWRPKHLLARLESFKGHLAKICYLW